MNELRDKIACWLCNAILNTIATRHYREMIGGSIRYGLKSAIRDERASIGCICPWDDEGNPTTYLSTCPIHSGNQ